MIQSILKNSGNASDIHWLILTLDQNSYDSIKSEPLQNLTLFNLNNYPDKDFLSARENRTFQEFCWSAASSILNLALVSTIPNTRVAYVDADCFFFSSIEEVFSQIPRDYRFAIHEHHFPENRKSMRAVAGRFNVGVICGYSSDSFKTCVAHWRKQVLDKCTVDLENGYFGDQKYLDHWPDQYRELHVYDSINFGLAPWNLELILKLEILHGKILVNGTDLIFYHFHAFRYRHAILNFFYYLPAKDYKVSRRLRKFVYQPYLVALTSNRPPKSSTANEQFGLSMNRMILKNLPRLFYKRDSMANR